MSDAADKLARSRLAIIDQIQRRDVRKNGRESNNEREPGDGSTEEPNRNGFNRPAALFGHIKTIASAWWQQHPASLGVEIATPLLSSYASKKPVQFLAIAVAIGAVVMFARPWRLISLTSILIALVKSSQLSRVLSAISTADFRKNHTPRR